MILTTNRLKNIIREIDDDSFNNMHRICRQLNAEIEQLKSDAGRDGLIGELSLKSKTVSDEPHSQTNEVKDLAMLSSMITTYRNEQMDQYDLYRYDTMGLDEALAAETTVGGTGAEVVEYACQFIGNRYVWGGTSLTDGCDCSGFVMKVYEHFGVSMPHSSYAQRSVGRAVSVEDMQPGDIVCYSGHVGIYAGNGQIVNASNSKPYPAGGIKYTNVGYRMIVAVRRIF